jgi:hypothetical protein
MANASVLTFLYAFWMSASDARGFPGILVATRKLPVPATTNGILSSDAVFSLYSSAISLKIPRSASAPEKNELFG